MKKFLIIILNIWILSFSQSFAEVGIFIEDDQSLLKNTSTQIKNITIVDDKDNTKIKALYGIKLIIPDSLKATWDIKYKSISIFGNAVDNGKIDSNPIVTYEKQGKIMIIPVKISFSGSESVSLSNLFIKTYHEYSDSSYLSIDLGKDNLIKTNKYLYIPNNDREDNFEPGNIDNIKLEQISNSSVKIIWNDPIDLDLQNIEIYRGLNKQTIGSNKYVSISKGIEYFIDTDLKLGDNVKYILKASDGRNYSQISDELNFNMLNINISTGITANISTGITANISTGIDKILPIFKTKSFSDFMIAFDKKIYKRDYKQEVRVVRNDIIELLKDYEDGKISLKFVKNELVRLVGEFKKVW